MARQFTGLCRKLALFGGELLAIDGSKFAAVNARDQNFNADKLQDLIARADVRLAEYLAQMDQADAADPGVAEPWAAQQIRPADLGGAALPRCLDSPHQGLRAAST